jgi:hypothetical protein
MTATLKARTPGLLSTGIVARAEKLEQAVRAAAAEASAIATVTSRRNFKRIRAIGPVRPGRSGTGGRMVTYIDWKPTADGDVALDTKKLDREAPHWIIQEIGTGQRAVTRTAGETLPQGRPKAGANYIRTVKSQKGRVIKSGIVFASGGRYSPAGSATGEQMALASKVGAPWRAPRITIEEEIKGQHFIRDGAKEGFRAYRTSVFAAARRAFDTGITD